MWDTAHAWPVPGPLGRGHCLAILQAQMMPVPWDAGHKGTAVQTPGPAGSAATAEPEAG